MTEIQRMLVPNAEVFELAKKGGLGYRWANEKKIRNVPNANLLWFVRKTQESTGKTSRNSQ